MGRAEGYDEFVELQHARLVGALHLVCGDLGVAEELAQTALERAWERWDRVSAMESPAGWVHQVAFNLARSRFRRLAAERRAYARHGAQETTDPEDTAAVVTVRRVLMELPPRQREAIVHRTYLGRSVAETATLMGTSEGAVKQLRSRADRRRRTRIGVLAAVAALLIAVPAVVLQTAPTPRVLLDDQPEPPETEASQPGLEVGLEGPLDDLLDLQVADDVGVSATVGYPVQAHVRLVVRATTRDVDLPAPSDETGAWRGAGEGLEAALRPPAPVMVLAGGPDGTAGHVVDAGVLPTWLPRELQLELTSTDLIQDTAVREVRVPLGDSAVIVTLTPTEATLQPRSPLAPADADGVVLDVPPLGEAAVSYLADGTPLWIANTERSGVTVVDGRTPFRPNGIVQLTRWCPSAQGFHEPYGGSRFLPDGTFAFGPAGAGLATYDTEPAGEGRVRITGGAPGRPIPPPEVWPPPTDAYGDPIPQPTFPGPFCGDGDASPDVSPVPAYDVRDLGDLGAAADAVGRVEGARLVVDADGRGALCAQADDTAGCPDAALPVALQDAAPTGYEGAGPAVYEPSVHGAELVVTVRDGIVVRAWMDGYVPPTPVPGREVMRTITRILDVRTEIGADECDGSPLGGRCAGVIGLERLQVVDDTGAIREPFDHEPFDADVEGSRLPDGWVVLDPYFGDGDASTSLPLSETGPLPDGTALADLPIGELVVVTVDAGRVLAVELLRVDR